MRWREELSSRGADRWAIVLVLVAGVLGCARPPLEPRSDTPAVKERGPNDPYYRARGSWGQTHDDQWGLKRIGFTSDDQAASVWDLLGEAKDDVIVAVIDSGLDYSHPDLSRENIWQNAEEIPNGRDDDGNGYVDDLIGWNFIANNNNPRDDVGHGTHVAGIIAAAIGNREGIAGMNPRVKIMPLKILDARGRGEGLGVAAAVFYAVQHGARVINLSLGGERVSRTEQLAIGYALRKGVVVVAAADSAGREMADYPPAGLRNIITVAATDQQDRRAHFSGWGQGIDIAAPGVDILSLRARRTDVRRVMGAEDYQPGAAFVGPDARYYRASGTSFAAAFVAGAASLLLSKNPRLTNEEVKRILLMSADDVDIPGWDQVTGYGRLNVARALTADPAFFLDARIDRVEIAKRASGAVLRVHGVADADAFWGGWLELGSGESPRQWRKVSATLRSPVQGEVLGEVPAVALRGGDRWTVRLVTEHANGLRREAWHRLSVR